MKFELQLDKDFEREFKRYKRKYPKLIELEGLDDNKVDPMRFYKGFIHSDNVANASIDANANVNDNNANTLRRESFKAQDKLLAFNKLFIEMKENFGLNDAKKWLEYQVLGWTYFHDASDAHLMGYCYSFSVKPIVEKGLFFIKEMSANPPKHLSTFNHQVLQFVSYASNQQSGAVGLADYLFWSFYFWKKEVESGDIPGSIKDKVKIQEFQSFIFDLNQPFMKVIQSAYTNFTIIDRVGYENMYGGEILPDGTFAIDYVEDFMQYQKDWLHFIQKLRNEKSFTFPVVSANLNIDKNSRDFLDEDMARVVAEHNMLWGDCNVMFSDDPTIASACCFDKEQICLTRSMQGKVILDTFENIYKSTEGIMKIYHNGNWVKGRLMKISRGDRKMFKVTTSNNKVLLMTEDHLSVTMRGDIPTVELTLEDYVAFSTLPLGFNSGSRGQGMTYAQGVFIGAYLGDGCITNERVRFTMNSSKVQELLPHFTTALKDWGIDSDLIVTPNKNNTVSVAVCGCSEIIEQWIIGNSANLKNFNLEAILQSEKFREGILYGLYATDGGNNNRIYSTSPALITSLECLLTSIGIVSSVNISDRTGDGAVIIRGESFNRNFPLYCLRYYNLNSPQRLSKDVYIKKNNTVYFKVKSIEEYESKDAFVYCFEMENEDEPYFTLPNGVITHNCRMTFDKKEFSGNKLEGRFSSISGSDLSIGSTKVNTINMARVGYVAKGNVKLAMKIIKEIVDSTHKILYVHRVILKKNINRGLLPLYTHGLISMDRQFGTVGVTGFQEFIEAMGGIERGPSGVYYTAAGLSLGENILKYINKLNEITPSEFGYTANIEQVPAESAAVKLCQKDALFFKHNYKLYSNQWIALTESADIMERVRVASVLDAECGGGQMLHNNLAEPYVSVDQAYNFYKFLAKRGIKYFSDVRKFQYCAKDHNFFGETCPICGGKAEGNIIKIVGYLVKDKYFSKERKEEKQKLHCYTQNCIKSILSRI